MNRIITLALLLCCAFYAKAQIEHGPYLQNVGENEATIVWHTKTNSIGWVEIAPEDGTNFYYTERPKHFDSSLGIKNISKIHAVTLDELKPGTTYRYRIYSQEVKGDNFVHPDFGGISATDVYYKKPLTFTTNDRAKPETTFLMVSDIHGRKDVLKTLLEVADYESRDAIIYNGDMVNHFESEKSVFEGFMTTSIDLFAKEKPMYYARGNHETRGALAPAFHQYFNNGEPHLYYSFRQGPICFVVLDTGEDKPDSDIEYYGLADFDSYRDQQVKWLEETLKSEAYRTAKYKVIIAHIPPAPNKDIWHGAQEIFDKFVPLLNKAKADVMLSGHLHKYLNVPNAPQIDFPIIINSNNTVIKGDTKGNELLLQVFDLKGKVIDKITVKH